MVYSASIRADLDSL